MAHAQDHARVKVYFDDQTIGKLARLGIETDHGDIVPGQSITTDLSYQEIEEVRNAGFRTEILIPDVTKHYSEQLAAGEANLAALRDGEQCGIGASPQIGPYATPANYTYGSMGGYHTYAELLAVLDDMRAKYPNLITVRTPISDTLLTHEGRPLFWVRISDQPDVDDPAEPQMLYSSLHHAREANSLSQMLFYMWHLLENYGQKPDIQYLVDNTALYFVPCVNPDGYVYNELVAPNGGGNWRKNRRTSPNGVGVDLNRNYGYFWGYDDEGSSPNPNSNAYRGTAPFSEAETRLMKMFCESHQFEFVLNYHTFSNLYVHPWGYNSQVAEPAFEAYGALLSRENKYKAGTPIQTVGYTANGTSDDWMYAAVDALSFTPEVGPTTYGFWPPADAIDGLNKANVWSNLSMAWSLLRFGIAEDLSAVEIDQAAWPLPVEVRRYGLQDGPLTVSLEVLGGAGQVTLAAQSLDLAHLEVDTIAFTVEISDQLQPFTPIRLVLGISNGVFTMRDTLTKIYYNAPRVAIYTDSLTSAANWTDGWQLTTSTFVSAPTSLTDSPNGLYSNDATSRTKLIAPIVIPDYAVQPQLRFWTRFSLENGYDWVQIEATPTTSGVTDYLCGRYTRLGTQQLPNGRHVYSGVQSAWVEECVSLEAYIGKSIEFGFALVADNALNFDGFFVDDLVLSYVDTTLSPTTVVVPLDAATTVRIQPQPAQTGTMVSWEPAQWASPALTLEVTDGFGKTLLRQICQTNTGQSALDVRTWPAGVYACRLTATNGQQRTERIIVTK
jgi:carboxypeptidase T